MYAPILIVEDCKFNLTETNNQMKTPISYYGGKQQLLSTILPLIPDHKIYTEPFFGGGAVFWAKQPSQVEVINDLNGAVVNFYQVLQSDYFELKRLVDGTLHSRGLYKHAMSIYELPHLFPAVTRAWAFWVVTQLGFSKQIGTFAVNRENRGIVELSNRIAAFTDTYSERLKQTFIESNDACEVIKYRDTVDTFHYVDPPYVDSDQGHYGGYMQEHFNVLLQTLAGCKGKFLMSSYPNAELSRYVVANGWYQKNIEKHLSASCTTGRKKVEMLTANYEI